VFTLLVVVRIGAGEGVVAGAVVEVEAPPLSTLPPPAGEGVVAGAVVEVSMRTETRLSKHCTSASALIKNELMQTFKVLFRRYSGVY
jgi:hypothetical protein